MFCIDWFFRFSFFLGDLKNGGHGWCSAGVGAAGICGHAAALGCQGFLPARRGAAKLCRGLFVCFFFSHPALFSCLCAIFSITLN